MSSGSNLANDLNNNEEFGTTESGRFDDTKNADIDTDMPPIGDIVDNNSEMDSAEAMINYKDVSKESKDNASKDAAHTVHSGHTESIEDLGDSSGNDTAMDSLGSGGAVVGAVDVPESNDLDLNDATKFSSVIGTDSKNEYKEAWSSEQANKDDNKDNVKMPLLKEEELEKLSFQQFNEKKWWFLLRSERNLELINRINDGSQENGQNNGKLVNDMNYILDEYQESESRCTRDWELNTIIPPNMKEIDFIKGMKNELILFYQKANQSDKNVASLGELGNNEDNEVKEAPGAHGNINNADDAARASNLLNKALNFTYKYHYAYDPLRSYAKSIEGIILSRLLADGFKVETMSDLRTTLVDIKDRVRKLFPLTPINALLDAIPMNGMRGRENITDCLSSIVATYCWNLNINETGSEKRYVKVDFLKDELPRGDDEKLVYEYRKVKYQEMMDLIKTDNIDVYDTLKCFENRFLRICDRYEIEMIWFKIHINDLLRFGFEQVAASANVQMSNSSLTANMNEALGWLDNMNMILMDRNEMIEFESIVDRAKREQELYQDFDGWDEEYDPMM